ncbi:MAG: hypothetical protein WA956_07355 [Stenotrophomonas sp.]
MRPARLPEPLWNHAIAALAALAVLSLLARLLWQLPEARGTRQEARIQLRWLPPSSTRPLPLPAMLPVTGPATASMQPGRALMDAVALPPQVPPAPMSLSQRRQDLYGDNGRVTLAPGTVKDAAQKTDAERVFEHRDELATGVGERATAGLFSKRPAGTPQSLAQRLLYGEDIQPAQARRPPDVAFNPALHERPADLGSAATGDAYKAAPIRHEPVSDLDGTASRRIRAAIGELERRYPRCAAGDRQRWLAPVLQHLDALQRLEYRYNHDADPVEAEHSLPAAADSAHELAWRGLWEAERQMARCGA